MQRTVYVWGSEKREGNIAHRSIVIKCYTVMIFYYTIAYDDALLYSIEGEAEKRFFHSHFSRALTEK